MNLPASNLMALFLPNISPVYSRSPSSFREELELLSELDLSESLLSEASSEPDLSSDELMSDD